VVVDGPLAGPLKAGLSCCPSKHESRPASIVHLDRFRPRAIRRNLGQEVALVDTDGRALTLQVHPASVQDRDGAVPLFQASRGSFPFVQRVFADAAHAALRASLR